MKFLINTLCILFFAVACSSGTDFPNAAPAPTPIVTLPATPAQSPQNVDIDSLIVSVSETFTKSSLVDYIENSESSDEDKSNVLLTHLNRQINSYNFLNADLSALANTDTKSIAFYSRSNVLDTIVTAAKQTNKAIAGKSVFVFARGDTITFRILNERLTDLVLADSVLTRNSIITAGYMGNSNTTSETVDCGVAANICVWVPSKAQLETAAAQYNASNSTNGYLNKLGTVAQGADFVVLLADFIKEVYSLSNSEVRARLFQTADATNCEATVCGNGVVNYVAAVTPVGNLFLPAGLNVGEFSKLNNQYQIYSNNHLVTPLADALNNINVAMLDELNAPFLVGINDVLNIEQQLTNSRIYAEGRTYGSNQIDYADLWDGKDASFGKVSKKFNASNRLVMHIDSSLTASNSLRAYEANCLAACLLSDEFDSYLTGDLLQLNFGNQDHSYSLASCVSATGNDCLMVANAINFDNIVLKSNILSTDELHDNISGKHQWMGLSVDTSTASQNINTWGNSNTDIASFGIDIPVNDRVTGFYQMQMVSSQWENPHQYAWLSEGSIDYDTHKFGLEMNSGNAHTRLQFQTITAQDAENFMILNLPVGRTPGKQIIYDQATLPLGIEQAHKLSLLYHTNVINKDNLRTVVSISADKFISDVSNQLSNDDKVKMAVSIAW